jgi:enterochelin esterase-like enzyme
MFKGWIAGVAALAALVAAPVAAQVKVEHVTVHGASLEGNLEGNSADRDVYIVLPASYATHPDKRYPVVYFLHGYSAHAETYVQGADVAAAEAAAEAAGNELILVLPDSYTRNGGSMYSNSGTTGDFETFVARDLVAYIDGHYRTLARRESRGLAGHSMGGYGTLRIGMKHAPVFSSLYAMSPCCLTARTTTPERAKALEALTVEQAEKGDFMTRADLAAAAAWSPAPDKPPFYLDTGLEEDGTIDPVVTAKWAANAPIAMLPQYLGALRSFEAVAMDVGDKDTLVGSDVMALHAEMERYGFRHQWEVYDGDHGNRLAIRFKDKVLPFFGAHLDK